MSGATELPGDPGIRPECRAASKTTGSGYPLGVMLRVHCVQLFYNLSDPGMEDLPYEVESVRRFAGLRLSGALPDETTILNFRHLLEKHGLGEALFEEINAHLASPGHRLKTGTIVDASIITAPSSTKNRTGERDPEMHQTRKGKQWYFRMKAHRVTARPSAFSLRIARRCLSPAGWTGLLATSRDRHEFPPAAPAPPFPNPPFQPVEEPPVRGVRHQSALCVG